jgi:hypothetical protein
VTVEMAIQGASFGFWLNRRKLRKVRRREGRYLLRTNLTESDPARLWDYYLQLVAVEEAFKTHKGDLSIRPIFHREEQRMEVHIFIAFLACCLHVTSGHRLQHLSPGLTTRSVLERFCAVHRFREEDSRKDRQGRHVGPDSSGRGWRDKSCPAGPAEKDLRKGGQGRHVGPDSSGRGWRDQSRPAGPAEKTFAKAAKGAL